MCILKARLHLVGWLVSWFGEWKFPPFDIFSFTLFSAISTDNSVDYDDDDDDNGNIAVFCWKTKEVECIIIRLIWCHGAFHMPIIQLFIDFKLHFLSAPNSIDEIRFFLRFVWVSPEYWWDCTEYSRNLFLK